MVRWPHVYFQIKRFCVAFLGKILFSHSASLLTQIQMCTGEFNAGGNPAMDRLYLSMVMLVKVSVKENEVPTEKKF